MQGTVTPFTNYTLERDNRELQRINLTSCVLLDYTLERDNRELQRLISFITDNKHYTLERDNRELQQKAAAVLSQMGLYP